MENKEQRLPVPGQGFKHVETDFEHKYVGKMKNRAMLPFRDIAGFVEANEKLEKDLYTWHHIFPKSFLNNDRFLIEHPYMVRLGPTTNKRINDPGHDYTDPNYDSFLQDGKITIRSKKIHELMAINFDKDTNKYDGTKLMLEFTKEFSKVPTNTYHNMSDIHQWFVLHYAIEDELNKDKEGKEILDILKEKQISVSYEQEGKLKNNLGYRLTDLHKDNFTNQKHFEKLNTFLKSKGEFFVRGYGKIDPIAVANTNIQSALDSKDQNEIDLRIDKDTVLKNYIDQNRSEVVRYKELKRIGKNLYRKIDNLSKYGNDDRLDGIVRKYVTIEKLQENKINKEGLEKVNEILSALDSKINLAFLNFSQKEMLELQTLIQEHTKERTKEHTKDIKPQSKELDETLIKRIKDIDLKEGSWAKLEFKKHEIKSLEEFLNSRERKELIEKLPLIFYSDGNPLITKSVEEKPISFEEFKISNAVDRIQSNEVTEQGFDEEYIAKLAEDMETKREYVVDKKTHRSTKAIAYVIFNKNEDEKFNIENRNKMGPNTFSNLTREPSQRYKKIKEESKLEDIEDIRKFFFTQKAKEKAREMNKQHDIKEREKINKQADITMMKGIIEDINQLIKTVLNFEDHALLLEQKSMVLSNSGFLKKYLSDWHEELSEEMKEEILKVRLIRAKSKDDVTLNVKKYEENRREQLDTYDIFKFIEKRNRRVKDSIKQSSEKESTNQYPLTNFENSSINKPIIDNDGNIVSDWQTIFIDAYRQDIALSKMYLTEAEGAILATQFKGNTIPIYKNSIPKGYKYIENIGGGDCLIHALYQAEKFLNSENWGLAAPDNYIKEKRLLIAGKLESEYILPLCAAAVKGAINKEPEPGLGPNLKKLIFQALIQDIINKAVDNSKKENKEESKKGIEKLEGEKNNLASTGTQANPLLNLGTSGTPVNPDSKIALFYEGVHWSLLIKD